MTASTAPGLIFRAGHAAGLWDQAIESCLEQIGDTTGNLGFLYISDALADDLPSILAHLRSETAVEHWVGTVGMGICASRREYFDEPAMAIMTSTLPRDAFQILPPLASMEELDSEALHWSVAARPRLGLVHGDPRNPDLPDLIGDVAERTAGFLVGGLSSSRGEMPQLADAIAEGGLSGVLFSDDVDMVTALTQGCTPIGPIRTVTQAADGFLLALDGQPALDVLREDMKELLARDPARAAYHVHAALPIPGSDTGDYLVRNLMGIDPARSAVAIAALVDPGDRVMFCRRDPQSAVADLRRMLGDLRRRLDGPPKGGLYVSCLARGRNMFGPGSRELGMIADELGDFPLVGFFANGEISSNRLYGYTGVLTLFR